MTTTRHREKGHGGKTSTFELPWPWIVPAAAAHYTASAGLFGAKVKHAKGYVSNPIRMQDSAAQLTTHFGHNPFWYPNIVVLAFFLIKRSKMQRYIDVLCKVPGEHTANSLQRKRNRI